jgi:hypothetical protein
MEHGKIAEGFADRLEALRQVVALEVAEHLV